MSYSAARARINDLIRIAPGGSKEKGPGVMPVMTVSGLVIT